MSKPKQPSKFWNIADNGDGSGVIDLNGELLDMRRTAWFEEVVAGNYYTSDDFAADLAACKGMKEVTVNINSPGGDLYMGIAIHNALRALNCKVKTVIQGIAASAASIIFCAGDERLVYPGSVLMVHGVLTHIDLYGYMNEHGVTEAISELKQTKKALAVMNEAIAATYASITGKSKEEHLSQIAGNAEKFMTAEDAISEGYATGYVDGKAAKLKMVACAGKTHLYSGDKLLTTDFHAPQNALALGIQAAEETPQDAEATEAKNKEEIHMSKTENNPAPTEEMISKEAAATAQQNAVNAAIAADRKRIADIDALAAKWGNAIDKELVNKAKYGNDNEQPMTAEQFALTAMNTIDPQKSFAGTRSKELAPNNNVGTAAAPVEGDATRAANGVRKDIANSLDRLFPAEK